MLPTIRGKPYHRRMSHGPRSGLVLLLLPWLGCADPLAVPGSTSSSAEMSSSSSSTIDTSAHVSSTGSTGSSGAVDSSGEASQGEGSTSAAASTGVDMPICGDGVLDPGEQCDLGPGNGNTAKCLYDCILATCGDGEVFATVEECDDQNFVPTDGCHECGRTRIVFVTSDFYQGGQFMGIGGADQRCRSLAAQAGLANFAGYKAWLSDSKTSPKERMYSGRGRYELVNGLLVADSWEALLAGDLKNPISATEKSELFEATVWTGTNPDGTRAEGADFCLDWTSSSWKNFTHYGESSETSPSWTMVASDFNPTDCGSGMPIYCFEQQ